MPTGTRVDSCFEKLKSEGKPAGSAAAICQTSTGQNLHTGKPLKNAATGEVDSPTLAFTQKLNDPSKWKIIRGVPCFDEHKEVYQKPVLDSKGKPVIDPKTKKPQTQEIVEVFDKPRLEAMAAKNNALAESGNPIGLTLGHTKDDCPESQQPITAGWAKNYRVGFDPQLRRHVIYQDEFYDPKKYEKHEVDTYPFRSIERYPAGHFKPVALLRREPRRNLGVVETYQRGGEFVVRYSMDSDWHNRRCLDNNLFTGAQPQRYSMAEEAPKPAETPAAEMPAAAPPAQETPPAYTPNPEDSEKFHALAYAHPHMGRVMKYAEAHPEWPGESEGGMAPEAPAPEMNAAGCPSGSNTMPAKMQATGEVVRYQADLAQARKEIAVLQKEARVARYGAVYDQMMAEGYPIDKAAEMLEVQDMTQPQFEGRIALIKRYAGDNRVPVDERPIRLANLPAPLFDSDDDKVPTIKNKDEMEKVMQYQAAHPGTSDQEALKAIRGPAVAAG